MLEAKGFGAQLGETRALVATLCEVARPHLARHADASVCEAAVNLVR